MKNIHIIPTDKPSRLVKFFTNKFHLCKEILPIQDEEQYQQVYITNDEEIKDCWVLNTHTNQVYFLKGFYGIQPITKKIILTTDTDLISDGVQAIDDEFLEWFVKNSSCEKVEVVEFEPIYGHQNNSSSILYKIIIPKEEPNYNMKKEILIEMMKQDEELGLYEETVEEYFLSSIKNMLQFNNDALAIRLMEKYYHAKKEQDETNNK